MINYITAKNIFNSQWSLIGFDVKTFIENQQVIVNHYEKEEDLLIKNLGCKGFIKSFDKYILHTIEEVIETKEELFKNDLHDKMEEMIDILMYLGSMNYILYANMNYYGMNPDSKIDNFEYNFYAYSGVNETNLYYQYESSLLDIVELLIKQRRLFPQRKWHKPSKEFSELEIKFNLNQMYDWNLLAMQYTISLLLSISNQNISRINEIINEKQNKVTSLPLPVQE